MRLKGKTAAALFTGINEVINDRLSVKNFRTRTSALELAARSNLAISGPEFVQAIFSQLSANWTAVSTEGRRSPSSQNFRWHFPQLSIAAHNTSPEVRLERALIQACSHAGRTDWSNQVPIISGIAGPHAHKKCAIDLVHQTRAGFEFVELKVNSNTPLYASIEILLYGLLWLLTRRDRHNLGYSSNPILDASNLQLSVLAPPSFYSGFERGHLAEALDAGLSELGRQHGVHMSFKRTAFPKGFDWPRTRSDADLIRALDHREVI